MDVPECKNGAARRNFLYIRSLCTGQKIGNGREARVFLKRADLPAAGKNRVSLTQSFFYPVHRHKISNRSEARRVVMFVALKIKPFRGP